MSPTPDPARTVAAPGATPSSSVVGDLGSILLLTAAWAGMAIQVDPRGEFSLRSLSSLRRSRRVFLSTQILSS
ncbi:MAG: hypothetical protein ACLQIB_46140 [Isosphaeraceae bacterium]